MALLYIDLDHFKFFNDSSGHGAGEDVIKKAAEYFLQSFP
ncbi:diguanylate cyclase [Bacillus sp. SD075]|nr:diguanylate cyclase [Bacillus sp. SD075]